MLPRRWHPTARPRRGVEHDLRGSHPRTIRYRGDGVFMISGTNTSKWRKRFKPETL